MLRTQQGGNATDRKTYSQEAYIHWRRQTIKIRSVAADQLSEKNKGGKQEYRQCEVQEAVEEGITEKATFGLRPEVQLLGKERSNIPDDCKDPETGMGLVF